MLDKEKILKEQRIAEAVDRNYIGLEGKFGVILKYLGKPIVYQGSANYETTEWEDVYDLEDEETIPEVDEHAPIKEIGKVFDGLKFGYHIEISYLKSGTIPIKIPIAYFPGLYKTTYEQADKVLKVSWKGYLVYLEAENDLIIFTPSNDWEDVILKIYESAEKLKKQHQVDKIEISQKEIKERKLNFLQRLRETWGI